MNGEFDLGQLQPLLDKAPEVTAAFLLKLLFAVAVFVIGSWLVKRLSRFIKTAMLARRIDPMIASFACNIIYYALFAVVIVAALGQLGVQTASFIALIGAAGLAIGFALQGSLSNFASGIMIIIFRPFKIGDYIEAAGTAGIVHEISIFSSVLKTPDNKTVIVPNAAITADNIINYSTEAVRRVDFNVGVSYSSNIQQVKQVLKSIAAADERVIQDRDVTVGLTSFGDSSINLVFRVWANTSDYWSLYFDINEKIKTQFDENSISIPFPQLDVFVKTPSS